MTIAEAVKNSATSTESERGHFVFEGATWEFYQRTLEQLERAGQHARVTFDNGRMEIMTTSGWHESIKTCVGRLLEHYSFVKDVSIQGFGSVTCQREDLLKAMEPDECYYIANKVTLDGTGLVDLVNGPSPDLVIEVEVSRSDVPKRPIYAAMGVSEVWSISADRLTLLKLQGGAYVPADRSRYFPELDMVEFFRFIRIARLDQHEGVKAFDAWVRGAGTPGTQK